MTVTAFDADVLIYAAQEGSPLGARISAHIASRSTHGIGSLILLPEVLAKPLRTNPQASEVAELRRIVDRLELHELDRPTGELALQLATTYGLRAADAIHLATAVAAEADQFLTNNRRDFPKTIAEIDVIYPEDLADLD